MQRLWRYVMKIQLIKCRTSLWLPTMLFMIPNFTLAGQWRWGCYSVCPTWFSSVAWNWVSKIVSWNCLLIPQCAWKSGQLLNVSVRMNESSSEASRIPKCYKVRVEAWAYGGCDSRSKQDTHWMCWVKLIKKYSNVPDVHCGLQVRFLNLSVVQLFRCARQSQLLLVAV